MTDAIHLVNNARIVFKVTQSFFLFNTLVCLYYRGDIISFSIHIERAHEEKEVMVITDLNDFIDV